MKNLTVMAIVLCGVSSWSMAVAKEGQGQRPSRGDSPPGQPAEAQAARMGRLLNRPEIQKELGLSPEQATALKNQTYKIEQERIKVKAELDLSALEQARLLTDESAQESAIIEAVEKTGSLRTALAKLHIKELLLVRANLTPEQRKKIRLLVAKHAQQRWGGGQARAGEPDRKEWQQFQEWRARNRGGQRAGAPPPPVPTGPPPEPGE